jgi:Trk-type K+ transport system membrane component
MELKPEQQEELGGVEYRALKVLAWILVAYFAFWLFLVMVVMTPYAAHTDAAQVIRTTQPGNLSPAWWSVFVTMSAYSNTGLSVLDKSMMRKYIA